MLWGREAGGGNFDTPEARAELEARLKQMVAVIADENVRRHYQQDIRDRLNRFFQPQFQNRGGDRRNFERGNGNNFRGKDGQGRPGANGARTVNLVSERLARSGLVRGHQEVPALRESVLALTVVNHPALMQDDYDEISAIEYDNRELQRLWSAMLGAAAMVAAPHLTRDYLLEELERQGFAPLFRGLEQQVRNARLWTATEEAAMEDAREGYRQALAFHKRAKALRRQKIELEREIAEATESGNGEVIDQLMRALQEVHFEGMRLENQEAIIDGFGVLSGRVKGAASH
jgi:DNA primase